MQISVINYYPIVRVINLQKKKKIPPVHFVFTYT